MRAEKGPAMTDTTSKPDPMEAAARAVCHLIREKHGAGACPLWALGTASGEVACPACFETARDVCKALADNLPDAMVERAVEVVRQRLAPWIEDADADWTFVEATEAALRAALLVGEGE